MKTKLIVLLVVSLLSISNASADLSWGSGFGGWGDSISSTLEDLCGWLCTRNDN